MRKLLFFWGIISFLVIASPALALSPKSSIPITPRIEVNDDQFLRDSYHVLLNRAEDIPGFQTNLKYLTQNPDRSSFFSTIMAGTEFLNNSLLQDKSDYVRRSYRQLLGREATPAEVTQQTANLKSYAGQGTGLTWYEFYVSLTAAQEYRNHNCETSYYQYGQALNTSAPTLNDLYANQATIQPDNLASGVNLNFIDPSAGINNSKIPTLQTTDGTVYGFSRGSEPLNGAERYNIHLFNSLDRGVNFTDLGSVFTRDVPEDSYYDPQVTADDSVCPKRYVMTFECYWPGLESASLCQSRSTAPTLYYSWTPPTLITSGCDNNSSRGCNSSRFLSASTGVALVDNGQPYVSWTAIDDGINWPFPGVPDEGSEKAYSSGMTQNSYAFTGYANQGTVLMDSVNNTHCTSPWDCNNRDKQDWKKDGDTFFLIYNGANYYRCFRPSGDTGTNQWGLNLSMANSVLGVYVPRLGNPLLFAPKNNICGIAYPTISNIDGNLYMYYNEFLTNGSYVTKRNRIVWPGDINLDNLVNSQDVTTLLPNLGTNYLAGDFNQDTKANALDFAYVSSHFR